MAAAVVHFEIIGKDGKRLQDFYSSLFDWKIDANNPMNYGMVEAGEEMPAPGTGDSHQHAGIGGGIGQSDGGPQVTFSVQVTSIEDTLRKAESMGGQTIMPPMEVPGGPTIAQFRDPEGNVIGLVKE